MSIRRLRARALSAEQARHQCDGPRWRDVHELPDAWLIRHLRIWFQHRGGMPRWLALYALRHIHCPSDGQCALRAGHRGGCDWGE